MKSLTITQHLLIILAFIIGSIAFNDFVGDAYGKLPVLLVLAYGLLVGVLAAQLEVWILKNKGLWPRKSLTLISREIIISTVWIALGYTLSSGILYAINCSINPAHVCGGPPFFVKVLLIFIATMIFAFPIGIGIGFINYFILSFVSKNLPSNRDNHIKITPSNFTKQDRLGGIGLFGILLGIPFLIFNLPLIGGVIILLSLVFLCCAFIIKIRA